MAESDQLRQFVFSALEELQVPVKDLGGEQLALAVPEKHRSELEGRERVLITFDKEIFQKSDQSNLEYITPGSPVLAWIIERVRELGWVAAAELKGEEPDQNKFINAVTANYKLDQGTVSVENPAWTSGRSYQFDYVLRQKGRESRDRLVRVLIDEQGKVLDPERAELFAGLPKTEPAAKISMSPGRAKEMLSAAAYEAETIAQKLEREMVQSLAAKRTAEENQLRDYFGKMKQELLGLQEIAQEENERAWLTEQLGSVDRQLSQRLEELEDRFKVWSELEPAGALLIQGRFFSGDLVLKTGERRWVLPLVLPAYAAAPPPIACMKSGVKTYHLAVTDDGRFIDADLAAADQETGRIFPRDELVSCAATGRLYRPEFMVQCPILLVPVHDKEIRPCPICRQKVSVLAMKGESCKSCQERTPVLPADERILKIIGRYPKLKSWSKWAISETRDIYNLEVAGALSQAKIFLRKSDLSFLGGARKTRLIGSWKDAEAKELVGTT